MRKNKKKKVSTIHEIVETLGGTDDRVYKK